MEGHERHIIHVDMDAFYASVEQRDRPDWKGRSVIVGGLGGRGVVSAASYEARVFGVHSAMPMSQARRLCPQAVFVSPDFRRYAEVSREINRIFKSYTPVVEPLSLDEAYLDVTGSTRLFGAPDAIGREIKKRILETTGLTASVGIAPNKFLAKLASELEKPDGFVVITQENKLDVLAELPVSRLFGVGKATVETLERIGITTISELLDYPPKALAERLGSHAGRLLELARGEDDSEVVPVGEAKSLSAEVTFEEDLKDRELILDHLLELTDRVAARLYRSELRARTVTLKVRFGDFKTITRSKTLRKPTNSVDVMWPVVKEVFLTRLPRRSPVRLVGVAATNMRTGPVQLDLFGPRADKRLERLSKATQEIRRKYGDEAIRRGRLVKPDEDHKRRSES